METWEIAEQEDLVSVLKKTLSKGWAEQYGQSFDMSAGSIHGRGQQWFLQPTLTTLYTAGVSQAGRRFMVDRFRFTPVTRRAPFQWMFGTALGSRIGLSVRGQALFGVDPPVPGAANLLVVPGSRRVRTFDLARGLSRSLLKEGYPVDAISNEVAVRGGGGTGPFSPLTKVGKDHTWFEEPLLDGFPLPRCPPWWPRRRYESQALDTLDEWMSHDAQRVSARARVDMLMRRIAAGREGLLGRFRNIPLPDASFLELLAEGAEKLDEVELVRSHGDLQPGNIHVTSRTRSVYLIDWEHTDRRFRGYDFLTYGLQARYPKGLGTRILGFIAEQPTGAAFEHLPQGSQRERAGAVALFLLEELERSVTDAAATPYRTIPYGFRLVCWELSAIHPELRKQVP